MKPTQMAEETIATTMYSARAKALAWQVIALKDSLAQREAEVERLGVENARHQRLLAEVLAAMREAESCRVDGDIKLVIRYGIELIEGWAKKLGITLDANSSQ